MNKAKLKKKILAYLLKGDIRTTGSIRMNLHIQRFESVQLALLEMDAEGLVVYVGPKDDVSQNGPWKAFASRAAPELVVLEPI
jgi:hypothetical protein